MREQVPARLRQLRCLLAAASLFAALGCERAPETAAPPDVLLITIDTLRADYLGTYGFDGETSPRIDGLAAQAVVFEAAIAASGRTVPSHAAILTSRYTREHSVGFRNGPTSLRGATTLASVFGDAGYATGAFTSNVLLTGFAGFATDFEVYDAELSKAIGDSKRFVERVAEATTERALEWLDTTGESPVFAWVHFQDPHGPYAPPPEFEGRIALPSPHGELPIPVFWIPAYQRIPGVRLLSEFQSRYADEIFYADHHVGALIDAFDARSSSRPDPIVLLTADHGESFGETPQLFGHTLSSTPNVAHVPFIVRAPGVRPGRRDEVVHHVDVLPTLLDLAGLPIPPDVSGISLVPSLADSEPLPDRWVYCDNGIEVGAYRGDEFLRVSGTVRAWEATDSAAPKAFPRRLAWQGFIWSSTSEWSAETAEAMPARSLPEEVSNYVRSAVPMFVRKPLSETKREQLEALGYVEAGASPDAETPR